MCEIFGGIYAQRALLLVRCVPGGLRSVVEMPQHSVYALHPVTASVVAACEVLGRSDLAVDRAEDENAVRQ